MVPQNPDTTAITTGRDGSHSLATPLHTSSVWASDGLDDTAARATATRSSAFYSRYANPTVTQFENAIAELEGAESAMAFASGMGAIASVVLAFCHSGSHIVAQNTLYGGTLSFLEGPCRRLGIDVSYVDASTAGAFAAAVQPGRTMLVLAETPSNPRLSISNLTELGAIKGPFTVVDSTMATPLAQRPLEHGVDLVLHSATKGIAGHNDAMLGVVAGEKDLIDALWAYSVLHGATASPYDALNGLRGIRTLPIRLRQQSTSALQIATALQDHPQVSCVMYPHLSSHPQHELAMKQMSCGGSLVAFEIAGGIDAVRRTFAALKIVRSATSFGGPETLLCHPQTSTHVGLPADMLAAMGVTDGLVRLSVGLEHSDDIIADVVAALSAR